MFLVVVSLNELKSKLLALLLMGGLSVLSMQANSASNARYLGYSNDYSRSEIQTYDRSGISTSVYAKASADELTKAKAIKRAKAQYGGKVLSAKKMKKSQTPAFKVKLLLPDGRVKTVIIK